MLAEQELELYQSDGKYRTYSNGIEKALKNFEYSSEWPDLISALGKLSKVISIHSTKFKSIPKTLIVSKRLAQCLHPSLPSGVHIKTLEVYDLIFKCLRGNVNSIFIYATGLFPLLQYAGITVRPIILKIYEDHFLQLGDSLEVVLDGLLIGLLNGMEDGSDVYERCTALLTSIKVVVSPDKFYPKLWSSMVVNTTRLPAINYMISDGFVPSNPKEVLPQLLECLNDSNILVQRSTLELLNTWDMKDWNVDVRVKLLAGSMGTLLRRDVSLNRRLFSMIKDEDWIVVKAARKILSSHPEKFRIIMMLFDKPEVSSKIMDAILLDVIRSLYLQQENDVMQMFIQNLEPSYVVEYLAKQELTRESCELIDYVYKHVSSGDFSPLLLRLIEPVEFKLKLGVSLLGHCSQDQLRDYDQIRKKLFSLYSQIVQADSIEFSNSADFEFKFDDHLELIEEKIPEVPEDDTGSVEVTENVVKSEEKFPPGDDSVLPENSQLSAKSPLSEKSPLPEKSPQETRDATPEYNTQVPSNDIQVTPASPINQSPKKDVELKEEADHSLETLGTATPEVSINISCEDDDQSEPVTLELRDDTSEATTLERNDSSPQSSEPLISSTEPLTNYFSLQGSFDCDSAVSCNHHFGLDPEPIGTINMMELKSALDGQYCNGQGLPSASFSHEHDEAFEQSDEYLNGMAEVILNDLNAHLEKIAKDECFEDKLDEDDDDLEPELLLLSRLGDLDLSPVNEDRADSSGTLMLESSPKDLSDMDARNSSSSASSSSSSSSVDEEVSAERLKAVLHRVIPKIVTKSVDNVDPWLLSLLTSCYAKDSIEAKQQALNAFLEIIPHLPLKRLRKHPVLNRIVESLWEDRNYETLSRFLVHFPETESLIVIKLNYHDQVQNFQEFIMSNSSSCVDNCILKLVDNLECDNNLLRHASFDCLTDIISKYSYVVVDPIVINLMDKSTRRHYTEYKSNSTPDLRLTAAAEQQLNVNNKFIHRSTGNLTSHDGQLNILVYNSVYDNRRIKFILRNLSKMLKFPEFILKLCTVNISKSPRLKLICKLMGQLYHFNNYNCNYINVVIYSLVNFIISFYNEDVPLEDVHGNLEIQVTACTILNELCSHLTPLATTNSNHQANSFSCYIDSVMKDTKLVKKILLGISSILNLNEGFVLSQNYRILQFNYSHDYYTQIILIEYIKLLTTLIQLEARVLVKDPSALSTTEGKKYIPNVPIMDQPIFKSVLLKGLQNCSVHWENLLRKSLSFCNNMRIVQQVIQILCENLTSKAQTHESTSVNLNTLTTILHDIILDTNGHDNSEIKTNSNESSWYNPLTWLPTLNNNNNNNNNVVTAKDVGMKFQAKQSLLAEFGMILKTVVHVWIHFPSMKPTMINLLNPIALHHMDEFISATSDIEATDDLVEIVFQLNVIRVTNLTNSTMQIITHGKSSSNIVNMLTLYSKYIEKLSTNYDLPNSFLINLIKEGSNLTLPAGQNLVLVILNRIMCTTGLQSNWTKNEIKELQEATQKLLESITGNTSLVDNKKKGGVIHQQDVIISSLHCLSENLHGLLDIVWGSDDKDKLLPILSHMIYLLMGHLKGKTSPTFTPTTLLLTNLTKYTHLRKAWKKEIFEYLIETSFFRMSLEDFRHWMVILDNIFSQDKASFTELIARATVPTSNSLNIFSSKETEYENRASLLKRLAVVIYSSETDEYIKFITSIQERISESLKASPNVIPNIQLNVFLLFRVLLRKLSANHLTSLWPIIIHEIGVVFSILEQHLINPQSITQYNIQKEPGLIDRCWSQLFASVFKLLAEASTLPVFRMYSWNFVNNIIPHLKQLNKDLVMELECNITSIEDDFIEF